jgi:uncharacterized protein YdaU (DUF1376 family)
MSKNQDPAFLMYSKDWLSGTAEYMPDEKGVYIDLLCHQHQNKSLPSDLTRLSRLCGLPEEKFIKIWETISCHFEQEGNRLVNRKLEGLMTDRAEKGRINTITGTFAGILRLGDFSAKQYKYLKDNLQAKDFSKYEKSELTERLTEWIQERLKSIGNGNEDNSNYKVLFEKIISENNIELPEGFDFLILEWLKYKSEKGQAYKETGMLSLIKKFLKDSGGSIKTGRAMLDYSMSKNYAGLFNEKDNSKNKQPEAVAAEFGTPGADIKKLR